MYDLAENIRLSLNDIFVRDESERMNKDGFYIINLDDSKGKGVHWRCCDYLPLHSCYFDSFGFVPPTVIEEQIKPCTYHYNNV